jgi:hypothetical protein
MAPGNFGEKMEEFLNKVRAHSFFPPKFPSIQRRPNNTISSKIGGTGFIGLPKIDLSNLKFSKI